MGNVLADAFELLAERHDRDQVRRVEHTRLKRLAAERFLSGDLAEKVRELKQTDGPDIQVMGSADMLQTLFKADLVDALELMIIPVTLGQGKRLFQDGTIPASFTVTSSQVAPKGIISVTYERDGDVKTGAPQIEAD